jgi:oxygen-independent coproporphyrinogen-3 oxidase
MPEYIFIMSNQDKTFSKIDLDRIAKALEATPTAAYSAPHDYPHAAPIFRPSPFAERERVSSEHMRLYIHIPFCNYACSFCCYAKRVGSDREQMQRYVRALKKELEWVEPGTPLSQFFMGGGTPTALPADLLDEVLTAITTRMPYYGKSVHTVETSPESMTEAHLEVLQRHGVGRISMGIQSLQEGVLDAVRRGHGPETALDTCRRIVDSGLILNIDLMYGLPGQTEESFYRDFAIAAGRGVHAVTAYNLRLNEHTVVANTLQDHERFDLVRLMRWRQFIRDTAERFGYTQTRWHTFKRLDTVAARHERLPVSDADMKAYQLGIGMSARSSLGHVVYRNHKGLKTYMERIEAGQSPVEDHIPLNQDDLKTQFIARTLGDGKGLVFSDYEQTFGQSFETDFHATLQRLGDAGLISEDSHSMRLTETGKLVYDMVTLSFYPQHARDWLLEQLSAYQLTDRPIAVAEVGVGTLRTSGLKTLIT